MAALARVCQREAVGQHWIFWDGECGFCRRSVDWLLARPGGEQFRPVPFQEAPSPPMTPEMARACADAVHVVTQEGEVLRAGRAVLFALEHTGMGALARLGRWPPFIWFIELGYWVVARNRRLFSRFMFKKAARGRLPPNESAPR